MPADFIRSKLVILWEDLLKASVVDWNSTIATLTSDQILDKAFDDIFAIMESPNQNYFLNTRSEVAFKIATKFDVNLTCRMDFIHTNPLDNTIMIFDGKGAKTVGKNVDKDQLYFYALLYYLHYKILPIAMGFFYYQHNKFVAVPVTMDLLNAFRERLSEGMKKINAGIEIDATPSWKACTYCEYRIGCTEYVKFQADHHREALEISNTEDTGIVQFGL
jgi:CRISPR/Cas system-associated exonuclease Cas4 (RecB family)